MNLRMDAHDLVQLGELMRRAPDIATEEVERAQLHATLLLQGELTLPPEQGGLPIGAGGAAGLAGSISTRVDVTPGRVIGLVESSSPHAAYVEFGTRPHWIGRAGIDALADWARARLSGVDSDEEARSAAFAIRQKIATKGTEAKPIWRTTFQRNLPKVREIFAAAIERIVARIEAGAAS